MTYFIRANARPQGRADLRLVVNAGSILEDDDQLGAAHFIEHMSFNGTRRFPKNELVSYLQSLGVRLGGDLNATTGFDETTYMLPIPVGDPVLLETGLAILREWAGNALLTDADIDSERAVVLAELRSGQAADARVRRQTMPRMFNGSRYASAAAHRHRAEPAHDDAGRAPPLLSRLVPSRPPGGDRRGRHRRRRHGAPHQGPLRRPPRRRRTRGHGRRRFDIPARTSMDALVVVDPELPSGRIDVTSYVRPQPSMATIGAYDALLQDQLVNRMLGMRLYELTDQPVRPFLAARAAAVTGRPRLRGVRRDRGHCRPGSRRGHARPRHRDRTGKTIRVLRSRSSTRPRRTSSNNYAEANAERNTSESDSLADELGRHFLTDEPVPGIAWEYERVKQLIPSLTLDAFNAHARKVLDEPGSQPFVLMAAPSAAGGDGGGPAERGDGGAAGRARRPIAASRSTRSCSEREPQPGRLVSETTDAALGTHDAHVRERRPGGPEADRLQERRDPALRPPATAGSTSTSRPTTRTRRTWSSRSSRWATARSRRRRSSGS